MQPDAGGGGGEHGCTEQHHTPATDRRDEGTQSHSAPPLPAIVPAASQKKQEPTASLLEDAVIEILSRVPYKSLCRFKCVSKPWLALCSDPKIQSRSPKALAGFFYSDEDDDGESPSKKDNPGDLHFHSLSGTGRGPPPVNPCLPFLRQSYERFMVTQCCSSLLLCKCWKSYKRRRRGQYDYVVCNPLTEQWTILPPIELPEGVASHVSPTID